MVASQQPDPVLLLARARDGTPDALGSLLELYRNYLRLLARTQIDLHLQGLVNPSDLVQEAMLEACRDFGQFRGGTEAEFLAWLRRILIHNLARLVERHVQAKKRDVRRQVSLKKHCAALDRSAARFDRALVSRVSSPSAQAQRRELAAILADQLAKLKPDHREVIVLRNLEGLSFEEVARRMKRPAGAVRMLWLRALDGLKQLLEEEDLL
jgi:RNA polymerase sigma-70 factor (ECF subfamily)